MKQNKNNSIIKGKGYWVKNRKNIYIFYLAGFCVLVLRCSSHYKLNTCQFFDREELSLSCLSVWRKQP